MYNVNISTGGIAGSAGSLVFDLSIEAPPSANHVEIGSFVAPGSVAGLPTTQGGLVAGDLVLPPFNVGFFTEIEGGSFFNELSVNFTHFGSNISFQLHLPEFAPAPGNLPDEFALFLLNPSGLPLFSTSDPTGADALFIIDITGAPGGRLTAFSPTTVNGQNINVVAPAPTNNPIPEPVTSLLVGTGLAAIGLRRRRLSKRSKAR
jgi:hypothetical protein